MKYNYTFLKKGEWNKWMKRLLYVEYKCFPIGERTERSAFRELINSWDPFTQIVTEEKNPKEIIAYYMCADLELSGGDIKCQDENWGLGNTLYLFSIATVPKHRGKGIGSEMLRNMIEEAKTHPSMVGRKYTRISLHTRNPAFERLAQKHGFKTIKIVNLERHKNKYMVLELE